MASGAAWYKENRELVLNRQKQRRMSDPDKYRAMRERADRKRLGLPEPTRPRPDTCECCGEPEENKSLNFDHDHTTGTFRGWLCNRCNLGIGGLGDTVAGLEQAINYLHRSNVNG